MAFIEDPTNEVRRRLHELIREPLPVIDDQEMAEREDAAEAYAGEDEGHFVDFCEDCVATSVNAMLDIRKIQKECLDLYMEKEPPNYAKKEAWQSKVVIPKPHGAVQYAMAAIRKAFSVDFLSIENEADPTAAEIWEKLMMRQLDKRHANFPIAFTDATGVSFAVGQSLEMIPVWRPGRGLQYSLAEPWKIHRDPDALSRHPQSGMYWIHQEYLDAFVLKEGEKQGKYVNAQQAIDSCGEMPKGDLMLTKEEIARRKNQIWRRSKYRKAVMVSEFWGTILDKKGEMLLPSATYTTCGRKVIRLPKKSPYRTLRWPGMSFSPLPNFLRYDGRGLLEGIRTIWYFMCSLLCLHADNLNWVVNPPTEIDISSLVDPDDVDNYPGKQYLTRGTISGQQAIRTVERKNITNEVLANLQYADQNFQRGTFVTDAVQGLPGYRAEITAREAAQNLDQALSVFGLMGMNVEDGAIEAISAGAETVEINAGLDDLSEIFPNEVLMTMVDETSPTGIRLPKLTGAYHVSGVSAVMRDAEVIRAIRDTILPLAGTPLFAPYMKPYNIIKSLERRLNLKDEGIIVDEAAAQTVDAAQQVAQEEAIQIEREQKARELLTPLGQVPGQGGGA